MSNVDRTLAALRNEVESRETHEDGSVWGTVYLDNARLSGQSIVEFRGALSQLAKDGFYQVIDGEHFGLVKISN